MTVSLNAELAKTCGYAVSKQMLSSVEKSNTSGQQALTSISGFTSFTVQADYQLDVIKAYNDGIPLLKSSSYRISTDCRSLEPVDRSTYQEISKKVEQQNERQDERLEVPRRHHEHDKGHCASKLGLPLPATPGRHISRDISCEGCYLRHTFFETFIFCHKNLSQEAGDIL